jgi:hypothetical protein
MSESIGDITKRVLEDLKGPQKSEWGPWKLEGDGAWLVAYRDDGAQLYEVPVAAEGQALHGYLASLTEKSWATPELIGHLIVALVDMQSIRRA